jgi:hypothetical protein
VSCIRMWIHIEPASTSTEVPDDGLTMLLKLGVATTTWNYSECFKGGVRDQVSLGHEVASTARDRDMAVGNEYRLAVGLGLFNTPGFQDKQVI